MKFGNVWNTKTLICRTRRLQTPPSHRPALHDTSSGNAVALQCCLRAAAAASCLPKRQPIDPRGLDACQPAWPIQGPRAAPPRRAWTQCSRQAHVAATSGGLNASTSSARRHNFVRISKNTRQTLLGHRTAGASHACLALAAHPTTDKPRQPRSRLLHHEGVELHNERFGLKTSCSARGGKYFKAQNLQYSSHITAVSMMVSISAS